VNPNSLLLNFDKHDKIQLWGKEFCGVGSEPTCVTKLYSGPEPTPQNCFLTLQKVVSYHAYQNSIMEKWESVSSSLSYDVKPKFEEFLAGHIVALVTNCISKFAEICSPMIRQFSTDIERLHEAAKYISCTMLNAVLSYL